MITHSAAKTVLVVDDCESICELIGLLLVRVGYHVRTATTAAGAIRIAHELPELDVALCGLDLPDMEGAELAVELSALHPSTAIVFVSASYKPNDSTGPFGVLQKPFTIAELRSVVSSTLRASQRRLQSGVALVPA